MDKMDQKMGNVTEKKEKDHLNYNDENDNLGLDADHSSEDTPYHVNLNSDNDRISHNPDGEDDDSDSREEPGHSPLMDK